MSDIAPPDDALLAHNKSRGRGAPAKRERPEVVTARQRALMLCRTWYAQPSELTGERVTIAGMAWGLNYVQRGTPLHRDGEGLPCAIYGRDYLNGCAPPPFTRWTPPLDDEERRAHRYVVGQIGRQPAIPTLAVEVASRFSRRETRTAERWVERLFDEANAYEYVHLAHAAELGRRALPGRAA